MSTTGPRRLRLGGAARPTGVESCCPTGARASARRSPACRGEASRRHRSRSERRPGTRIHPRCDRPDVVGRPTLPVVRGDAHRGRKQPRRWLPIGGWRLALAAMLVARSSTSAALRHPTRENRLVRRLGDFGGCLRQLGRFGSSTEDRDGHIIPVGFDRDDDPPLARAADDGAQVGHDRRHTPFATPVGVSEQEAFDSRLDHGNERKAIGCLQPYPLAAARQTGGLDRTLSASTGGRLERVSERLQQVGAVAENRKDRLLLVCRECELDPVRVECKPDVVGQSSLAGALKTTCEHRDSARGHDYTGDQHRCSPLTRLVSRQTVRRRPKPFVARPGAPARLGCCSVGVGAMSADGGRSAWRRRGRLSPTASPAQTRIPSAPFDATPLRANA